MSTRQDDLSVRQHERYRCDLPGRAGPEGESARLIKLSPSVADPGGQVRVKLIDASRGGVGLSSPVFLPQSAQVRVVVELPGGGLDFSARVQRVRLSDRAPTYYLGCAFAGASPEQADSVKRLLEHCSQLEASARA